MISRLLFIALLFNLLFNIRAFAAPNIVVSIKPLHSIVSLLTQGLTKPELLLKNNASAHHFHLKATQLSKIDAADLIVFVHPNFEAGLKKTLANIKADKKITLSNQHNDNHHQWLDIDKMIDFSTKLSKKLIEIDAPNQLIYRTNAAMLIDKLSTLKAKIKQQLSAYKQQEVASFSNAFEHFLNANDLKNSTIVSKSHGARLSLFKLLAAKQAIKKNQTKCLLSAIDVPNKYINILSEDLAINTANIDIIGNSDYFKLMKNISNQISQCLK